MANDVLVLTDGGVLGRAIANAVLAEYPTTEVIVESPVSRVHLFRRRVRRLGLRRVIGQIAFIAIVVPILAWKSRVRLRQIVDEHHLDLRSLPVSAHLVPSVNSPECHHLLEELHPQIVVLAGTRIVDKATLARLAGKPVLNVHAGVTPTYRGVHGAYWALWERRPDLAGSTVHRVDQGIDTGAVILHCHIPTSREDTFVTYPYSQIGVAIPALLQTISEMKAGGVVKNVDTSNMASVLRTHPTIWEYLGGLKHGVK